MEKRLQDFKDSCMELFLQFLWRQWSALGLAGYAETQDAWVVDPEALLIFSCAVCRHDQRLFDEIIDWLSANERFINIQRLRTIMKKENSQSDAALGAIAEYMTLKNPTPKWKRLAEVCKKKSEDSPPQNLFFMKSGNPLPVPGVKDEIFKKYGLIRNPVQNRSLSKPFPPKAPVTLLLQLRALIGVCARCEVLLYLLLHDRVTIQEIADQTYYSWRSVQDILFEMGHSGLLTFPEAKRSRTYRFSEEPWLHILLKNPDIKINWICWPPLFRALELIWNKLNDPVFVDLSVLGQATQLRTLMTGQIALKLERAGIGSLVHSPKIYEGEEYIDVFLSNIKTVLNFITTESQAIKKPCSAMP
jgi:hypothetical protein